MWGVKLKSAQFVSILEAESFQGLSSPTSPSVSVYNKMVDFTYRNFSFPNQDVILSSYNCFSHASLGLRVVALDCTMQVFQNGAAKITSLHLAVTEVKRGCTAAKTLYLCLGVC